MVNRTVESPKGLNPERLKIRQTWISNLVLVVVLLSAAYLRFAGMNWDENQHLHPDERFLTMVETAISPVKSLAEYFNTEQSSLNPNNRGQTFYVYGTLPLFIVRYIAEGLQQTGYDQVFLVGRYLSALFDLMTVLLVYLTALRLFRNKKLSLLAAGFSAFSVLPIQLSHFFTVDTFANFFLMVAVYFAVRIQTDEDQVSTLPSSLIFAVALGMAMASKLSTAPAAVLLPLALFIRYKHLPDEEKDHRSWLFLRDIVVAGLLTILVFRIFNPYAFKGPGFFDLAPNERWIASLKELAQQISGNVDFPPALQWVRRPIWYALQNLVLYGLGLPLGLLAVAGFLWMGWRILKGEWKEHILLWGWSGAYFAWQSLSWTSSMRYLLAIYPVLTIIAAWATWKFWEGIPGTKWGLDRWFTPQRRKIFAAGVGVGVLAATIGWAVAFSRIYSSPMTRLEASRWFYQNIPAPVNLQVETQDGIINQPLAFNFGVPVTPEKALVVAFQPQLTGTLKEIEFGHIIDSQAQSGIKTLEVSLLESQEAEKTLTTGTIKNDFSSSGEGRGQSYKIIFDRPANVFIDRLYYLKLNLLEDSRSLNLSGSLLVKIITPSEVIQQSLPEMSVILWSGTKLSINFTADQDGILEQVNIPKIVDLELNKSSKTIELSIQAESPDNQILGTSTVSSDFILSKDPHENEFNFTLEPPLMMEAKKQYTLNLEQTTGSGIIAVYGSKQAKESTWDDALPVNLNETNAHDINNGVYQSDLNFEMYWDDNEEKKLRFISILDQADYIVITSSRQWGSIPRLPERYPLVTSYYRSLLGCPAEKEITWCFSAAEPGLFKGSLGFELIKIFQSEPGVGTLRINTQFAEEALTVFDHPKVFIFKKSLDYNPELVRQFFNSIDLSYVMKITPLKDVKQYPDNLMMPADRFSIQQAGGTWSEIFNRDALINRYPLLGMIGWYLAVTLLGWMMYPFIRMALGGLPDRGYPFARLCGMLILAFLVWMAASSGLTFSKEVISAVLLLLAFINFTIFYHQKNAILTEFRQNKRYYLTVEILFLAFFAMDLIIRIGNPDLWHPYKGGEKPMEFSYFNAVLKSTIFPPYDPWFAGGTLNYYYYGYVIVGVLVKWLGLMPSIAFNLILPTLFSFLAMGAFSIGWNLLSKQREGDYQASDVKSWINPGALGKPFYAGIASSVGLLILGNLGTVRMIWHGFQKLAVPGISIDEGNFFQRWLWTFQGIGKYLSGTSLPYPRGDWYWIPSRVFPGEPITEFPFFSFLYADLHAHLIALPITVLALACALALLKSGWQRTNEQDKGKWLRYFSWLFLVCISIGALRPTNTWDMPIYLAIVILSILYTAFCCGKVSLNIFPGTNGNIHRLIIGFLSVLIFVIFSFVLYQPFSNWYGQGYTAIDFWKGDRTPFWSYLTHWGLFLFLIVSWILWETRDWLAKTPLSALKKLQPFTSLIVSGVVLFLLIIAWLTYQKIAIGWLAVLLICWSLILLLRPGQSNTKRFVLMMIAAGLALTLGVEMVVLRGDLGRMNTVFKFYLQAWTLLSLSAASGLAWLIEEVPLFYAPRWRVIWQAALILLVGGAALFPIMGGVDKIRDRMAAQAPHSLDGMQYMAYSEYSENDKDMDLSQDYRAIIWMQTHVKGSPVIVEANMPEYRWGNRFTINTGLPSVVGWNWHQRQQRALTPSEWVTDRVEEIGRFYRTIIQSDVQTFLNKYNVRYIVVGQLERAIYPGTGLAKFSDWEGILWKQVYVDRETAIYEVIR